MPKKTNFKRLQEKWYKKIEKAGFVDIEKGFGSYELVSAPNYQRDPIYLQSKMDYYRMATNFLHDYEFESKLEQTIWEYHAEGISIRDIVNTLKKVRIKTYRHKVWTIINHLETEMKKMYL